MPVSAIYRKRKICMTELERIEQAEVFFRRYGKKEEAIRQNRENQEYLKTLIHDDIYVRDNYDMKARLSKEISIVAGAALAVFLLVWLVTMFVPGLVVGCFVFLGGTVFFIAFNRYKLDSRLERQSEINDGIIDEIERLKALEPMIQKQKADFVKGLEKHVPFLAFSDMKYLNDLREFIMSGEADTCEDAAAMLEQKLLLQQFTTIMENKEIESNFAKTAKKSAEEESAGFENPLESIKPSRKKSLRERIFGKRLKKKVKSVFDEQDEWDSDPYSPDEIIKYVQAHSKGKRMIRTK